MEWTWFWGCLDESQTRSKVIHMEYSEHIRLTPVPRNRGTESSPIHAVWNTSGRRVVTGVWRRGEKKIRVWGGEDDKRASQSRGSVAGELYAGEGIAPTSRSSREQAWGGPWRRLGRATEGRRWAKEQRMWRLLSHRLSSQLEARRYAEKMRCGKKKLTRI